MPIDQPFTKLVAECRKSLEVLAAESQQTLELLLVVKKFPTDPERKIALQLQCHREDRLREGYECRRRELLQYVASLNLN